jgi:peptidyl-dipeptidase A
MGKRVVLLATLMAVIYGCAGTRGPKKKMKDQQITSPATQATEKLKEFIKRHVTKVAPMTKEQNLAYWKATTTGDKKAYQKVSQLEMSIRKLYSPKDAFLYLKETKKQDLIKDPILKRQLDILYLAFLENQFDPVLMKKIVELSTKVQKQFNDFRGVIDGKEVTDNDIFDILKSENDQAKRKAAWEAYKTRGAVIRDDVIELVNLRNKAARQLGYNNFYEMSLLLIEQDPDKIKQIFDDLAQQTDQPFAELMQKIDAVLSKRFNIQPTQLRPWHYEDPFFQEAPTVGKIDLDPFFEKKDLPELTGEFFKGIGLDPKNILKQSDLYERQGKMPHAYCTDIDRLGDVRILANLRDSEKWTSTLLHELGHAVYDIYIDSKLTWLLRSAAHSFVTEATAMFFGRLTRNTTWLQNILELPDPEADKIREDIKFQQKLSMLVFARWTLVLVNFERELYSNPEQDLNKLWWELKKRYQLLIPPEGRDQPDWASKIHVAVWPAYYHNYMLGELLASQMLHHIAKTSFQTTDLDKVAYHNQEAIGRFFKEQIFAPGKSLSWDKLLINTFGESLNPKYFVDQFVRQ